MAEKKQDASLNRRAFKAGIFYIVSQLIVRGITFLMTPVFTRLLSQTQYNQYKIYESWLLIFAPVMSLCLWRSVERAKYDVKEKFNEYVSSVQTLSYLSISVFFVVFLIFRKQVEALCSMNDFMLIIAFLYTYAHTSLFYIQRREKQMMRYRVSTTITAVTVIPATLLSVLLVVLGKRAGHEEALMQLRIAGYYIPMIIGGLAVAVLILVQGKKLINVSYWKYALKFSLPLIPEVLSIQIMNQADKLMVTAMTGDIKGSVFAVATTVSYIIWILEDSVWNAWLAVDVRKDLHRRESRHLQFLVCSDARFGVISWALVLFAPEIILLLGGHKYADAVYLVAPMVTGTLFRFYSYSYTAIQNYHKKTASVAASTVSVMFLNVILNYLGILWFGYQAAAYTTAFSYMALMVIQAFMEKRLTGEQLIPLSKTLLISCGYFAVCVVTMGTYRLPSCVRYLLAVTAFPIGAWYFLPRVKPILKMMKKRKKQ
ncbi:MAG: lipopolysaccharide biosynthesis protein [Lachnospiraceae bacterium]